MIQPSRPKTIMFLLPTLPHYRNDFFALLNSELGRNYRVLVVHGTSSKKGKVIRHETTDQFDSVACSSREFTVLKYRINWIRKLSSYLKNIAPDMVIVLFNFGAISFWRAVFACKFRGIPVAFWGSGHKRPEIRGLRLVLKEKAANLVLKLASAHICYGSRYADELRKKNIEPESIFVAQNTIDVDRILTGDYLSRDYYRESMGISSDEIVFLFVGALIRNKKLDIAIETVGKLARDGYAIKFFIVGDGEEKDRLRRVVHDLGLGSCVAITGAKYGNDLPPYFLAADAFLLPGTGGLAVNEAMAYGLPVISTEGDGTVVDLLANGVNGFMLHNNLDNLKEVLVTYMRLPFRERLEMGRKSREIMKKKARLRNMVAGFRAAIGCLAKPL